MAVIAVTECQIFWRPVARKANIVATSTEVVELNVTTLR